MQMNIGRCGVCGGPVTVPAAWYGINPPTPTCQSCGRSAKPTGPVLEMDERK